MKYFSQGYFDFFEELRENNSKEWFDVHRSRYEQFVKDPFKKFLEDLSVRIREVDPEIEMEAKHASGRINRDIRFSKDKTPYNTYMKSKFAKGGKKSDNAGYYFALSNNSLYIGGGAWGMDKKNVKALRDEIAYAPEEFKKLISDKKFIAATGGFVGESMKRIPKEYKDVYEQVPEIALKEFYYMKQDDKNVKLALKSGFMDYVIEQYHAAKPVNEFLKRVIED